MVKTKASVFVYFRDIFAFVILIISVSPMTHFYSKEIILAFITIWCFLAFLANPNAFLTTYGCKNMVYLPMYLWALVQSAYMIMGLVPHQAGAAQAITITLSIMIFWYYYELGSRSVVKGFVVAYLVYTLFIATNTILLLQENPMLSRFLAQGNVELTRPYASWFTADYSVIYSLCVIVPLVFHMVMRHRAKPLTKFLLVCWCAVQCVLIFQAQYTMAIIILGMSLLFGFIRFSKRNYVGIVVILSILLFLAVFGGKLAGNLSDLIPISSISERFKQIAMMYDGVLESAGNTTLSIRFELYQSSWMGFLQHPFLGQYAAGTSGTMGGHSTALDFLSLYGILGGGIFVLWVIWIMRRVIKKIAFHIDLLLAVFIGFLVIACINVAYTNLQIFSVLVIAPLVALVFKYHYQKE